jgi:flagellar protein FlaI
MHPPPPSDPLARIAALEARFDPKDPEGLKRALRKALARILERSQRIRPGFSQSWVTPAPPDDSERILEYMVGDSKVAVFRLPNETELLYHLVPFECQLPAEHIRLIDLARLKMLETVPQLRQFRRPQQARRYVSREGARIISQLAQERMVQLGASRAQQVAHSRKLAEVLARYTAGLGITEHFLLDSYVQDIYMDAPAHLNPVYVTIGGLADPRARGRCRTNVSLGAGDAESLLSRFRFESGRPFSEARPYLETDLLGYSTRVTVIGKPLSPEGVAIALRRHSTDPWTLPKLVAAGSLTPLAAGLLSFFIDGQSTILVAGGRGAGKTSLVGALMLEFPRSQRILTIEDTLELPSEAMKSLGYKLQSMQVRSSLGGMGEMSADEALRLSLRMGESAIIMGEVRGQEARTLYEAMRAGTAGSSVLGTIHGNSARAVHERVVHDMGIPSKAFSATDIVVVAGLRRPFGTHRTVRRITEISEVVKDRDGEFRELLVYDEGKDALIESGNIGSSERVRDIARSFNLTPQQALQAIRLRAQIREDMVSTAAAHDNSSVLGARWVADANDALWGALEKHRTDFGSALEEWRAWFGKMTGYR